MRVILTHHQLYDPEFQQLLHSRFVGVTVGNFDGMHAGHQALLCELRKQTIERSKEASKPPFQVLLTFNPHPRVFLKSQKEQGGSCVRDIKGVTTFRERITIADNFGLDAFVVVHFTSHFASLDPEEFVRAYLYEALHPQVVIVGHDWRFGKGRAGDSVLLEQLGEKYGFSSFVVPPVYENGERVSTTQLKELLLLGEIEKVNARLGRNYSVFGRVLHGAARGRTLGFPTANISCSGYVLPKNGVYIVQAIIDGHCYQAVANVGVRPTFDGRETAFEVHILNWSGRSLYNERFQVEFLYRIRDEIKFDRVESLQIAVLNDIIEARRVFAKGKR